MQRCRPYRVGRPRPGTLRLWAFHEPFVWERLQQHGYLYFDLAHHDDPEFILACLPQYDWMREQMAQRLPGYRGHYPWWAWFRPKPDLRRWGRWMHPPGTPFVRLELALEPGRVLLSVEPAWVMVLNRGYIGIDRADYIAWDAGVEEAGIDDLKWPLPEPWQTRVVSSWERIFDVEALTQGDEWSDAVQATFERLDLADVVAVTEFAARGRPPG